MSKVTGHHNSDLRKYILQRDAEQHERGASGGFRATKQPNELDRLGLRDAESTRTDNEWHVKNPSALTYNKMLYSEPFPNGSQPLTPGQLQDQQTQVRKSLLSDSFWSALLGESNVAKTRHWKGAFEDGAQEQHYMASRIDPDVKGTITDLTDSDHRTSGNARPPMTEYQGKPIVAAMVEGKPIEGFGRAAAISYFLGSPDQHPGNFGLNEGDDKISVFKFDNKFDMAADERFPRQFSAVPSQQLIDEYAPTLAAFEQVHQEIIGDRAQSEILFDEEKVLIQEKNSTIDYNYDLKDAAANLKPFLDDAYTAPDKATKIAEGIKKINDMIDTVPPGGTAAAFIKIDDSKPNLLDQVDAVQQLAAQGQQVAVNDLSNLINTSKVFGGLGDGSIPDLVDPTLDLNKVIELYEENITEYQYTIDYYQSEIDHLAIGFCDPSLPLGDFFKEVFHTQANEDESIDHGNKIFNFPFGDDFHTAQHAQEEFMETAYLIMNMEPAKLTELTKEIMGEGAICPLTGQPISQEISTQLQSNQTRFEQTIGQHPKFQEYVANYSVELTQKLEGVHTVLDAKMQEFSIDYERSADKGKFKPTDFGHPDPLVQHDSQLSATIIESEMSVSDRVKQMNQKIEDNKPTLGKHTEKVNNEGQDHGKGGVEF